MFGHHRDGRDGTLGDMPRQTRGRTRRSRRLLVLEGLEDRALLSSPTVYTVDLTSDTAQGSGTTGDIAYVLYFADQNPNPGGSIIQFDPRVFGMPQTITLQSPIVLSDTSGPMVIDGPGANLATVSGNNAVQPFQVMSGVTATIEGLTITAGVAANFGGGISNAGMLTVQQTTIEYSSAIAGTSAGGLGGGIYNDGALMVTDSTIANNSAQGEGGGVFNRGTLTITGSTIANNSALGPVAESASTKARPLSLTRPSRVIRASSSAAASTIWWTP